MTDEQILAALCEAIRDRIEEHKAAGRTESRGNLLRVVIPPIA